MQRKKFLALTLAVTMVLGSALTVSAATGVGENTTGNTITGSGEVEYLDTTIYQVTLPTTASTQFTVDPLGLTDMESDSATLAELLPGAGKVFMNSLPVISNISSVPMKVSAELTLTGDATPVTTEAAVTADTSNNILLYAVPSIVDVNGDAENYINSTKGIVLGTTAATVDFILPAADYVVKRSGAVNPTYTYELADADDKGHGTALEFKGLVNKTADWADYASTATTPKTIGLTAKFTFTSTLASGDVADTTAGAPYAMKEYTGTTVAVPEASVAPSIKNKTYTMAADTSIEIPVKLGVGQKAATGISAIGFKNNSGTDRTVATDKYTFANGTLTLKADFVNELINANITSRDYTITFNDTAATTVKITLTVSAPPSIATTRYIMTSGQNVVVNVNLGAGEGAATGITSIGYLNNSGAERTVDATNYSLVGSTLTISSTFVDSLITSNVNSRDFTITFNDSEATAVTITLASN